MLLVQYFSAFEAYLSDRLIRLVLDDRKAMSALVKSNKECQTASKIDPGSACNIDPLTATS